jgi:hypothetical protein
MQGRSGWGIGQGNTGGAVVFKAVFGQRRASKCLRDVEAVPVGLHKFRVRVGVEELVGSVYVGLDMKMKRDA